MVTHPGMPRQAGRRTPDAWLKTPEIKPSVTVYRAVASDVAECSVGATHIITVIARKELTLIGHFSEHNGYGMSPEKIFRDEQCRTYRTRTPVDFHGSPSYIRDDDVRFTTREPPGLTVLYSDWVPSNPHPKSAPVNLSAHVSHCCLKHGCKYGKDTCPVTAGRLPQAYPCEQCSDGRI